MRHLVHTHAALAALAMLAAAALAPDAVALDKPALQDAPGDDVLMWIEIPDLRRAIDHLEIAAGRFATAAGSDDAPLAEALSSVLGPQQLDALKPGAPVVMVVLKPTNGPQPEVALFVPARDAQVIEQAAPSWQLAGVATVGDVVVLSDDQQTADRLKTAAMPTYQALAQQPATCDVRVHIGVARAWSIWGPMARMAVGGMVGMAAAQDPTHGAEMAPLLKLYAAALMHVLDEIDAQQVDLSADDRAITVRALMSARAGTPLARVLSATPNGANPALALMADGQHAVAASMRWDPAAYAAWIQDGVEALSQDPSTQTLLTPAVVTALGKMIEGAGGDIAFTLDESAGRPQASMAVATRDPSYAQHQLELNQALMAGPLASLFSAMQTTVKIEPAAREHDGVSIVRSTTTFDPTRYPGRSVQVNESAQVGNWAVMANTPSVLDALIDRAKHPPTTASVRLAAEQQHGTGRSLYADVDVLTLVRLASPMPIPPPASDTKPAAAMTAAADCADGVMRGDLHVPYAAITPVISTLRQLRGGGHGGAAGKDVAAPTF